MQWNSKSSNKNKTPDEMSCHIWFSRFVEPFKNLALHLHCHLIELFSVLIAKISAVQRQLIICNDFARTYFQYWQECGRLYGYSYYQFKLLMWIQQASKRLIRLIAAFYTQVSLPAWWAECPSWSCEHASPPGSVPASARLQPQGEQCSPHPEKGNIYRVFHKNRQKIMPSSDPKSRVLVIL